jgi:hypothetical protein
MICLDKFNLSIANKKMWHQGSILSTKMVAWATKFCFGDQNVNLVASVTTSIIEVGDRKFWIIFHQREKEYLFLLVYLVSLATNCFLLWPLKFEFGHQIFDVDGQLPTKIKIPL